MMVIVPTLVAVLIGWLAVRLLLPLGGMRPRWAGWAMEVSLAAGLGMGITSVLFFLLLLCGAGRPAFVVGAEALLLLALAALAYRLRKRAAPEAGPAAPGFAYGWIAAIVFAVAALMAGIAFFDQAGANPFGEWDAWSIWNVRARFLAAPGEAYRNAWSPLLGHTHPDYPLLLSGFVARSWKYFGGEVPQSVPIAAAFLFQFGALGLLVSAAALARGTVAGLAAGMLLLASRAYLLQGPSQYADVPLSYFILGALAVLLLLDRAGPARNRAAALAGCLAALAAWTKNEGMLFFVVFVAIYALAETRASGLAAAGARLRWLLIGAAPVLLVVLGFRFLLAPAADPFLTQGAGKAVAKLGESARWGKIARSFYREALNLGGGWTHPLLLACILAAGLRFRLAEHRKWVLFAGPVVALMLAGYFGAYLVTPSDLDWHLNTSMGRLYVQIWPAALLVLAVALRRLEDFAIVEAARPPSPRKAERRKKR